MLKPIKFLGVFALLLAIGFFTAGGCFDGDMQKYTFGGTIPSEVTLGDGDMVDDDGGGLDKANFGGIINACECGDLSFWDIILGGWCDKCVQSNILYHDMPAGIMIKAKVRDVEDCTGEYSCSRWHSSLCCVCDGLAELCGDDEPPHFMIAAKISYRLQGPLAQENENNWMKKQTGVICATDNGEGANAEAPDFVAIKLLTGPKSCEEYANCGPVSGNVKEHECEDEEADFLLDF